MKKLFITILFMLFSFAAISQVRDTVKICCYSVQLFSTTIYPYPFEGDMVQLVGKDSIYTEMLESNGKIYHRYLVKCSTLRRANELLAIVRERYKDAFIVYYYSNGKRFN